jgi:hypothetical protein
MIFLKLKYYEIIDFFIPCKEDEMISFFVS